MANGSLLFIIMAGVFLLAILTLFGIVIYINNKHRKRLEEITVYQIHTSSKIDQSIPEILDLIIRESFADYQVKYLLPLDEQYINSEREAQIRKDLASLVTTRISNAAMDKISLFYNIVNIADIIADKIYILVMNYVTEHNSQFTDE